MNNNNNMKLIYGHTYNGGGLFGKAKATDRCGAIEIHCSNSENCELYNSGKCILRTTYSRCIYGKKKDIGGPTRRAKSYYSFQDEYDEKYKELPKLKDTGLPVFPQIGEYIFINISPALLTEIDEFRLEGQLVHRDDFNFENISLLYSKPVKTLFGGELVNAYYKQQLPIFTQNLARKYPELYTKLAEHICDKLKDKPNDTVLNTTHKILLENNYKNCVGRMALLSSLNKNIDVLINDKKWRWDGECLTRENTARLFFPSGFIESEVTTVYPTKGAAVKIHSEDQYDPQKVVLV